MSGRRRPGQRSRWGDRGSVDALGLALLAPAAIGLAVLVVSLGRGVDARAQVRSAAAAGAQAAALERTAVAAERAAATVIGSMLVDADACPRPDVTVTYPAGAGAGAGPGTSYGTVRVTVRCQVSDRGLELVRSGDVTEEFTATATVDLFRTRVTP